MAAARQAKHTWLLVLSGFIALGLVMGIVALDSVGMPINGVIRVGALLGYLAVFVTCLSAMSMRALTRFFGRPFIKVHHIVAVAGLVALMAHAIAVAWRAGTLSVFLPRFDSVRIFLSLGGRPAFWLFAVTSLTAVLRAAIGRRWRVIHWLNYLAFLLGTIHAQLIGTSFINHLGVRLLGWALALVLVVMFVYKRTHKRWRRGR